MDFYKDKHILLIAEPSETMRALVDRLEMLGASVNQVQVKDEASLSTFDVSAHAKLSHGLANADRNRTAIRNFVSGWFSSHTVPDMVLYCPSQKQIRNDSRAIGAPLRHFVAASTLIEYLLPILATQENARLSICVGLDSNDFFGPSADRVGYRALESYLKTWEKNFQSAGVTASFMEYLEPSGVLQGNWPKSALTGFFRSLHPYTPDDVAKTILESAIQPRIGQKLLRTEALFWLGKLHRQSDPSLLNEMPPAVPKTMQPAFFPASTGS